MQLNRRKRQDQNAKCEIKMSDRVESHEYIWTSEFNDYALIPQKYNGVVEYLIYHIPRRSYLVIEDEVDNQAVIAKC